jgi:hypothetical protein
MDIATKLDQRQQPRHALLLRVAKLCSEQGEFVCIIRNVSETGVKLRLFNPIATLTGMALELGNGDRFPLEPVWQTDDDVGFRFIGPIDVQRFIAEPSPWPKRPIRLRFRHAARISIHARTQDVEMLDVSRKGACIETTLPLAAGQRLRFDAVLFPSCDATVCWRKGIRYGLVFAQTIGLETLAQRTAMMQAFARATTSFNPAGRQIAN